jgi:hypothetical protein
MGTGRSALAIIFAVAFTLVSLAYNMGAFDPKDPEPEPSAELSAFLLWEAYGDPFGGEGGSISIHGDIDNNGDEDGSGTVHIRVFDGYEWMDRYQDTGLVPAGGSVPFSMNISFDRVIVNAVDVTVHFE